MKSMKLPAACTLLICLALLTGCTEKSEPANSAHLPLVKIGISQSFFAAPMVVAGAADTFSNYGVNAEIHGFQSGKKAYEALLSGEIDVASVADMPLMETAFSRTDFAIISTFSRSSNQGKIVALRKKITSPTDLTGKHIGVALFTTADYYLQAFLKYNNINANDVHILDRNPEELADLLESEQVDAIATWEPYVTHTVNLLGKENVTEFYMTNVARVTFNVVSMKQTIRQRPEELKNVIRAIADAVEMIHRDQNKANQILATELHTDVDTVVRNLPDYQMYIGLDQGLVFILENQAEWFMEKHGLSGAIPNFLQIIDTSLLYDVNPDAVTLID